MYLRRRIRIYVNRLFHEDLRWTMDKLAIDGRHCRRVLQDKPVCGRREDRYGQSRCVAIGWPCLTKEGRRSLQGMWCDPITPPTAQSPIRYQPNLRRGPLASPFRRAFAEMLLRPAERTAADEARPAQAHPHASRRSPESLNHSSGCT